MAFFDRRICTKQAKPNPQKNFFENYYDHLNYLESEFDAKWNTCSKFRTIDEQLEFLGKEALKRLNLFERLRDGYDYMDEVVGATALPVMLLGASLANLAIAIWEGASALAISTGLINRKSDKAEHLEYAQTALLLSTLAFVGAIATFLKSAISLITRPVATALQGFAEQDVDRFYDDDSYESQARRMNI